MASANLDPINLNILDAIQRDERITKLTLPQQVSPVANAVLDAAAQAVIARGINCIGTLRRTTTKRSGQRAETTLLIAYPNML